ncbi:MAG: DNA polymerase III subunit epsilon [Gammaproteobacteria bacterium]|nr:DNA polymerase III subunit epsilon [Gammaproteobacteria bacterium]
MRQIILDTETTGLGHASGHRIIEIGCLELIDRSLTGEQFHVYLNPDRAIDPGAMKVHGIKNEFLVDKPRFADILEDFLSFVKDAELIIHNAPFDMGFLNAELKRAKYPKTLEEHCGVFDTLVLAKEKHPGQRNNLDALCKRYDVVNSHRKLHGALLDSELLALVYLAMTGGQASLFGESDTDSKKNKSQAEEAAQRLSSQSPVYPADASELSEHDAFIQKIIKKSGVNHWTT